jgi:hypothetical protein
MLNVSTGAMPYESHFKIDQQVTVVVRQRNKKFLESNAVVVSIDKNHLCVEMLGAGLPADVELEPGAEAHITFWTGWAHYRCNGILEGVGPGKQFRAKLFGEIIEQQRRDYFRLDMALPTTYQVLSQHASNVDMDWTVERERLLSIPAPEMETAGDGYKVLSWNGKGEILPREINLSGGGIRFKTPELWETGTLVAIDLFLPLAPCRVIHTIAEVLRSNEITLRLEKGTQYMTAMRFIHINEKDRETIISFIFTEQRRLLQLSQDRIVPIR